MSPIAWSSDGRTKAPTQLERAAEDISERMALFTPEPPRRRLADLVLSAETERALQVALAKIQHHTLLYQTWGIGADTS